MKNHNLALNEGFGSGSNPMVRSANLTGSNPFHADMAEAAELAKPCFLLNVVADGDFNIIRAFAGDYIEAHAAACKLVDEHRRGLRGGAHPAGGSRRRGAIPRTSTSTRPPRRSATRGRWSRTAGR